MSQIEHPLPAVKSKLDYTRVCFRVLAEMRCRWARLFALQNA